MLKLVLMKLSFTLYIVHPAYNMLGRSKINKTKTKKFIKLGYKVEPIADVVLLHY